MNVLAFDGKPKTLKEVAHAPEIRHFLHIHLLNVENIWITSTMLCRRLPVCRVSVEVCPWLGQVRRESICAGLLLDNRVNVA
jgi:hypothetical protein